MCNFKEGLDSSDRRKKGLTSYYHIVKVRLRCCACRTRAAKLKPNRPATEPKKSKQGCVLESKHKTGRKETKAVQHSVLALRKNV